jgi:hypothetical protein
MSENSPWEDSILERKVESDLKDLRSTLVAFANSVAPEHVATLLIGEKNDGSVQGVRDPDSIQKRVRAECDRIYPSILWRSKVYEKQGKYCVQVEVSYSGKTPHFGDAAWIRRGSENIRASEEMLQRLIDLRSEVITKLEEWLGKKITIEGDNASIFDYGAQASSVRWRGRISAILREVNRFWATFELDQGVLKSEPVEKLLLSFDDRDRCLKILVKP